MLTDSAAMELFNRLFPASEYPRPCLFVRDIGDFVEEGQTLRVTSDRTGKEWEVSLPWTKPRTGGIPYIGYYEVPSVLSGGNILLEDDDFDYDQEPDYADFG